MYGKRLSSYIWRKKEHHLWRCVPNHHLLLLFVVNVTVNWQLTWVNLVSCYKVLVCSNTLARLRIMVKTMALLACVKKKKQSIDNMLAGLGWVGWLAGWLVGLVSLFVGWFVGRYCCLCWWVCSLKSTVIVNNPQISLAPKKKHQRVSVLFFLLFFCVFFLECIWHFYCR